METVKIVSLIQATAPQTRIKIDTHFKLLNQNILLEGFRILHRVLERAICAFSGPVAVG